MIPPVAIAAQPPSSASSRVPRAEAVARDLEIEILCDGLSPGKRLGTKDDIRQRFGVAVATINEAVRLLEMRGLIEARPGPGGGLFVANSSVRVAIRRSSPQATWGAARYADCLVVRTALEPIVCRDAAAHHDDEDLAAMRAHRRRDGAPLATDPRRTSRSTGPCTGGSPSCCRNAPLHSIYLTLLDFLEDGLDTADLRDFDGRADVDDPPRAGRRDRVRARRPRSRPRSTAHVGMPMDLRNPIAAATRRVAGRSRPSAAR